MMDNRDRAIGRIEGKLDLLIEENVQAAKKKEELHQKIDSIQRRQDRLDHKFLAIDERLEHIEKPLADLNRWRERAIGAVMLISFLAASIGGTAAVFWQKILGQIRAWI